MEKCRKVHGDKYDYSNTVYYGIKEDIEIECPKHGTFSKNADNHINLNQGCPLCGNERASEKLSYSQEDFEKKANEVHGGIYDYSKSNYTSSTDKVDIICRKCGKIFKQEAASHMGGHGCINCYKEEYSDWARTSNKKIFIEKALEVHGNKYSYEEIVYKGAKEKIELFCKEHETTFKVTPSKHTSRGQGCPKCSPTSHIEVRI